MQAEKTEAQPPKKKKKEVPRKEYLLVKKAKNHDRLPPAEQKELDEILAAEEAERKRNGLLHKLAEAADKQGRKAISRIKREVTDRVRDIGKEEAAQTAAALKALNDLIASTESEARKAMNRIQTELNAELKRLREGHEAEVKGIRQSFSGQYGEAETEINNRTEDVTREVTGFIEDIQSLPLERLEELHKTGVTELEKNSFIVVPGQTKPA